MLAVVAVLSIRLQVVGLQREAEGVEAAAMVALQVLELLVQPI
jgi:hypothetical protein